MPQTALEYVISIKDKATKPITKIHKKFKKVSDLYRDYDDRREVAGKKERKAHKQKIKELTQEERGIRKLIKTQKGLSAIGRGGRAVGRGIGGVGHGIGGGLSAMSGGVGGMLSGFGRAGGAIPWVGAAAAGMVAAVTGAVAAKDRVFQAVEELRDKDISESILKKQGLLTSETIRKKTGKQVKYWEKEKRGKGRTKGVEKWKDEYKNEIKTGGLVGKMMKGDRYSTRGEISEVMSVMSQGASDVSGEFKKLKKASEATGLSFKQLTSGIDPSLAKHMTAEEALRAQMAQQMSQSIIPEMRAQGASMWAQLNEDIVNRTGAGDAMKKSGKIRFQQQKQREDMNVHMKGLTAGAMAVQKGMDSLVKAFGEGALVMSKMIKKLTPAESKKASGGTVIKDRPYLVGERRPEMFIPTQNGTIKNSVQTATQTATPSKRDKNINVNMNVDVNVKGGQAMDSQSSQALQKVIKSSISETFKKDVRMELGMEIEE